MVMSAHEEVRLQEQDAKRRKRATKSKGSRGNELTFINVNLSKADKEAIKSASLDPFEFCEMQAEWCQAGYKHTSREDVKSGGFMHILSGVDSSCQNKGLCLTARGATWEQAALVLLYKVNEMLPEDWLSYVSGETSLMA